MKEKIKNFFKSKIFFFVLGIFVCGTVGVYAETYFPSNDVTYDNNTSGMLATNVQGAIDELYGVCKEGTTTSSNEIKDNIVTSGTGLYKDEYEEGRYFYKGANPNNYLAFAGTMWRIISLENDGTIKIIRDSSTTAIYWDSNRGYTWSSSTLYKYLIGDYYNSFSTLDKNKLVSHDWTAGALQRNESNLTTIINEEKATIVNAKVGLPTVSEFIRTNSNIDACESLLLYNSNYTRCKNTTWMNFKENILWWLITPSTELTHQNRRAAFSISATDGSIQMSSTDAYEYTQNSVGVHPTIYLSSDVKLKGSGTESDPYTIN